MDEETAVRIFKQYFDAPPTPEQVAAMTKPDEDEHPVADEAHLVPLDETTIFAISHLTSLLIQQDAIRDWRTDGATLRFRFTKVNGVPWELTLKRVPSWPH